MGLPVKKIKISVNEYLELENSATQKHELIEGEIYAMTGTTRMHNRIVGNIFAYLHPLMKGKLCKLYFSDIRVHVEMTDLITYPDLVITCGEELLRDTYKDTLLNPKCIIEVLSDSTEKYDRGEKFSHYQKIENLTEYILVSQNKFTVESYIRDKNNKWIYSIQEGQKSILTINTIDINIPLETIYFNTDDLK